MTKIKKIFFQNLTGISVRLILVITLLGIYGYIINRPTIDTEQFRSEGNYTDDELLLFADIAFTNNRIRKWEEDIRVEIKNMGEVSEKEIAEVDSAIAIFSPLVYPLKMYRVLANGNLVVNRRVDTIDIKMDVCGICRINPSVSNRGWKLRYVETYDLKPYHSPSVFLHEFEHALGLSHPSRQYPFYMIIVGREAPHIFKSIEESEKYLDMPFYVSEEEKKVIKMLYSPHIKPGLKKRIFMKKMGLYDNI